MLQGIACPNKANGIVWLSDRQLDCVANRMFIESGLSIDNYLALIDPDYVKQDI